MTGPHPLDDWRTATRYRWTRPDGSLDIAAMCRAMDEDYAARFGTGEPRTPVDGGEHARETGRVQTSGPGGASTPRDPARTAKESRHD